jgi:RimJ/RimL family protein N-acetyltransferase
VEVGYHVRRELWGRGFATEAAAACRDYARDYLRLRRLIAIIHPDNAASRAVARKIGMSSEGEYARKGRTKVVYAMALAPENRSSIEPDGLR